MLLRTVRASEIAVCLPPRQRLPRIVKREEDFHVQTFIAKPPIKTLDEPILDRLSRSNEVELNPVTIGPGVHDTTGKFTAVVDGDRTRGTALPHDQF